MADQKLKFTIDVDAKDAVEQIEKHRAKLLELNQATDAASDSSEHLKEWLKLEALEARKTAEAAKKLEMSVSDYERAIKKAETETKAFKASLAEEALTAQSLERKLIQLKGATDSASVAAREAARFLLEEARETEKAAAAAEKLGIKLSDYKRAAKQAERETSRYRRALQSLNAGIASGIAAFRAARTAVLGFTAAVAAVVVPSVLFLNSLEERMGILNRFTGNIQEATERVNGLMSELELMRGFQNAQNRQLGLTAHQFATVAVAANEMAASIGVSAEDSMTRLIQALTSGGEELRQFGIQLETGGTIAERRALALEQLEEAFGGVESQADTAGGSISMLTNTASDMWTAFLEGTEVTQGIEHAFESFTYALTGTHHSFDELHYVVVRMATMWGVILGRTFDAVGRIFDRFGNAVREAGIAWEAFEEILSGENIRTNIGRISDAVEQMNNELRVSAYREEFGRIFDLGAISTAMDDVTDRAAVRRNQEVFRSTRLQGLNIQAEQGQEQQDPKADSIYAFQLSQMEERHARAQELRDQELQAEITYNNGLKALEQARMDERTAAYEEMMERRREAREAEIEAAERWRERHFGFLDDIQNKGEEVEEWLTSSMTPALEGALTGLATSMGQAFNMMISGEKSAAEAMEEMGKMFLRTMAEKALIESLAEVARAISAAASMNFASAAAHGAAAVAWGAVAAATGAGAAAAGAYSSTSANVPTSPQSGAGDESQAGSIIINWNSPTVTASTEEELGRSLASTLEASQRRDGGVIGA